MVERVKELGEEKSIEFAALRKWPVKDSGKTVVEDAENQEDVIEAGESYEEMVERVLHILRGQDINREGVAKKSKKGKRDLKECKMDSAIFSNILSSRTVNLSNTVIVTNH